jgi:hypothetical protein
MSKNFILWRASTKIMFQRLHELSALFPEKELWQRINEGMPAEYSCKLAADTANRLLKAVRNSVRINKETK